MLYPLEPASHDHRQKVGHGSAQHGLGMPRRVTWLYPEVPEWPHVAVPLHVGGTGANHAGRALRAPTPPIRGPPCVALKLVVVGKRSYRFW